MNEQLQSKLVEILAGIQAATKTAGDFAMEQLPDITQQYVMYGRASHSFWLVIGFLIPLALFFYRKQIKAGLDEIEMWPVAVLMTGGFSSVAILSANISPFFLIWFAPKVWLLKELASLIK